MSADIATLVHASGAEARVLVSQGFNCFAWSAAVQDGVRPMLYAPEGFESGDQRASSGGTPILFPFPGRIEQGRYEYAGKQYQVPAGDALGNAIHGFVFNRPWRVVDQSSDQVTAEFVGSVDAPDTLDLWPSDYAIRATYRLEGDRLTLDVTCSNPGDSELPYGLATHAYFRLPLGGGDPEQTEVQAPVDAQWELKDMIPTAEHGLTDASRGFAAGMPLAGQAFDSAFRLNQSASGEATSSLSGDGVRLTQTCGDEFKCYVIYTPGHREAICIEPYTCLPSPFGSAARGAETNLLVLQPGESRQHRVVLQVEAAG